MPRASRVAAPGAKRIAIVGQLAASNDFGRVRLLLLDTLQDGTREYSKAILAREVPVAYPGRPPYVFHSETVQALRRDGVVGEVTLTPPGHLKEHWLRVAENLRGREVRVEATVRPYIFREGATSKRGVALDISMIEPYRKSDPRHSAISPLPSIRQMLSVLNFSSRLPIMQGSAGTPSAPSVPSTPSPAVELAAPPL